MLTIFCVHGSQRLIVGIFLNHFSVYFLREGLLPSLKLFELSSLAGLWPEPHLWCEYWVLNSDVYVCVASSSLIIYCLPRPPLKCFKIFILWELMHIWNIIRLYHPSSSSNSSQNPPTTSFSQLMPSFQSSLSEVSAVYICMGVGLTAGVWES